MALLKTGLLPPSNRATLYSLPLSNPSHSSLYDLSLKLSPHRSLSLPIAFKTLAIVPKDNYPVEGVVTLNHKDNVDMEGNNGKAKVSWIYTYLPKIAQPYAQLARLDSAIVTWLFVWPCFWAIALAASPGRLPNIWLLTRFGIASFFIRGYGCTINDIFDREMDRKVQRCKQRPIASGAVKPLQGIFFLFLQFFACLLILFPVMNNHSKVVGIPFFPLATIYPLMKRFTYWPQAFLGVTLSWMTLVAWSAVKGSHDFPIVLPLYISLILWTLTYDTIYAHQDRADDVKAGVKSTAVLFGDSTKIWCTIFGIVCIGCLAISGFNATIGWPFYASLIAAAAHLTWQITAVNLSNPKDCKNKFVSNIWFGALIFNGICLGRLLN